jgi:hypothetical protein
MDSNYLSLWKTFVVLVRNVSSKSTYESSASQLKYQCSYLIELYKQAFSTNQKIILTSQRSVVTQHVFIPYTEMVLQSWKYIYNPPYRKNSFRGKITYLQLPSALTTTDVILNKSLSDFEHIIFCPKKPAGFETSKNSSDLPYGSNYQQYLQNFLWSEGVRSKNILLIHIRDTKEKQEEDQPLLALFHLHEAIFDLTALKLYPLGQDYFWHYLFYQFFMT